MQKHLVQQATLILIHFLYVQKLDWQTIINLFLFIPIAILNGILRNNVYQQFIGELPAHQLSTIIASLAFVLLAFITLRSKLSALNTKILMIIGFFWVVMTILFEFGFGHYVVGHSWNRLLADYNIASGRIWVLFLLSSFLTPILIKYLSKFDQSSTKSES